MANIQSKEILIVPIKEIKLNPKNRNKHPKEQIDRLVKIIEYQGFRTPVTVSNRTGLLVAGHGRMMAAKKLGYKEVPAIFQDFDSEEQEIAHGISDNAIALWSELDMEGINVDLEQFQKDFDKSLLGIKNLELEKLPEEPGCDEDEVPEKVEPKAKLGDIYQLGNHRLMCGDSTSIDAVEKLMNGEKADMVFTDPPYGVDYKGINNDSRDGLSDLLSQSFDNYLLSMKSGAAIYVFHSDKCADKFHEEFRKRFHFSSIAIWVKPSLVMGQSDYQSRHEPIIYGWKEGEKHYWSSDRKQTSIWEFGRESHDGHTTPKPVELISYALTNSSKSGDAVLDLFGGSGSTLIACEKTNRKCFMMELDSHYISVIIERYIKYTGRQDVYLLNEDGSKTSWSEVCEKR